MSAESQAKCRERKTDGMSSREKLLKELIKEVEPIAVQGNLDTLIHGLCADSRQVRPGDLFLALPGQHTDGVQYAGEAVLKGAAAVLCEQPIMTDRPAVIVKDAHAAMARVSAAYYDYPADHLKKIGVTGSNGKTTCAYLVESILRAAGYKPGLLSTIEYRFGQWSEKATVTTPLSIDLHRLLRRMADEGADSVSMEVSSHALTLKRVDGLQFSTALFLNLSHDHLDFHGSMDAYGEAKKKLFTDYMQDGGTAVLNADDPYVGSLVGSLPGKQLTFSRLTAADITASTVRVNGNGVSFILNTPKGEMAIRSSLLGEYNLENLVASAAVGVAEGLPLESIRIGLESVQAIPGRLEPVQMGQPFKVLVDFAHTPDALQRVLQLLNKLPHRRLITVFGCGGERDKQKRPHMGRIVCQLSDQVIVTTDNPRAEDPRSIMQDIEGGMKGYESKYRIIYDRRKAIVSAIEDAGESDIVLLAGKGHERTQTWADRTCAFDDREVAESALRAK
jgi:UDP-N-acetylmuramoyl-L-alanyl-D-glutamate--2,6-diaminopimelate ligase